ncbi:chromatin structure-remodeling complex protein BSH [Selaginella moellendorffii]|uniref:chromatin structure-remodeling complex protein BSH n=1 Tax=Selaginella moellendorffii TaxID=88036 RepID=UPI000D1C4162|nr:chromatin structure-remodeling complex protein BSH [Selaginella moellendorffii]|eukprot:XP_024524406.1 chromatin structure-remodeling complex protein BSH [Selaginella moellendorffii]
MRTPAASRPVYGGFRMPTAENLIPMRLDIELDSHRFKDSFSWNAHERDSEIMPFARRLVAEMNLPPVFTQHIVQSMQAQLNEFRSLEAQQLSTEEKVLMLKLDLRINNIVIRDQFLWDVGDFESDPEGFARGLCKDLEIEDPEVAPGIAFAIREQLYEIAKQNVTSARETRITKKARRERGIEFNHATTSGTTALNLMRRPNNKISIIRKKTEWELFEPFVEVLTEEESNTLDAKENARLKKLMEEKEDSFASRYVRS